MNKGPTAIVTGITGQDGSYLAELLLSKGYRVVGVARKDVGSAGELLPSTLRAAIELATWDMMDPREIVRILAHYRPVEIYNFAGYSSGAGMYDDAIGIGEVNGVAVVRVLEAIRQIDKDIRLCQASSSEVFGIATESPQSEETPFRPRSPYGAAKVYADLMIRIYRQRYGLFACSAFLFNHESPRRAVGFVTRKVTHEAAKIKLGLASELRLGNLSARRDWGFAGDYVRAMWVMSQQPRAEDFVVATGETHSVRELCELAFGYLGLDYREYVREDVESYRSAEPTQLVGNSAKARSVLRWSPEVTFRELVTMMVDADLQLLQRKMSAT